MAASLGTTLAMMLFARKHGIPSGRCSIWSRRSFRLALFFVRVANFINSRTVGADDRRAVGRRLPTGGPFARHPSQLYEALPRRHRAVLGARALSTACVALKTPGFVAGAFVCGYGLSRIFVEFFREPDASRSAISSAPAG
jgi:phosphatidylglycerol:prolipoprotein diacylglycerol transferase